ncbi:uncharacterized protein LOC127701844 [Mytilus californianus]|uniref:uncharacterized protein LOC127701844 n=1 Tax=Mytilus californianus TaxID=6549 RepID=UPI0022456B4D|nr:uncharacterized protein LOC127701844 [Mytilus californianus]XP_052061778.1 uncharacterized protein LOC127701844 [Mytilus californianus]XP_052061779.1 uncharacterized protein LOC127701844 [Mytilus californianus]
MKPQPPLDVNMGKVQPRSFSHFRILVLCMFCTVVYAYLYINIAYRTETISKMMDNTLGDLQYLQSNLEKLLRPINTKLNRNTINTDRDEIIRNEKRIDRKSKHLLVLFTTFTTKSEKYVCRNNTINNWISFGTVVKPVFFSDDQNLSKEIKEKGWDVIPPTKTAVGVPILKYMYLEVMKRYSAHFYGYVNGDILLTQNLIDSLQFIFNSNVNQSEPMLIVGQRTNVKEVTAEQASTFENITKVSKTGILFTPWGADYFITNAVYPWKECPEVVIGRRAYDNWLILNARKRNHTTIDATETLLALHQTTKAGNVEGHTHSNGNFNDKLLRTLYKRINYAAGLTSCTTYTTTRYETTKEIQLLKRKIGKTCFPI